MPGARVTHFIPRARQTVSYLRGYYFGWGEYLGLLEELRERHRLALVFVTHNLGIVARICDRVAVMYAGRIVEMGPSGGCAPSIAAPSRYLGEPSLA